MKQPELHLNKAASDYILRLYNHECWFVGKDNVKCYGRMVWNHILSSKNKRTKWEISNLLCGCVWHNAYYMKPREKLLHELVERHDPARWAYLQSIKNQDFQKQALVFDLMAKAFNGLKFRSDLPPYLTRTDALPEVFFTDVISL